jgi:hypothetical protein
MHWLDQILRRFSRVAYGTAVLLPGSRVGAGEAWGGVPRRRIHREEMARIRAGIRGMPEALG